MSPDQKVRPCGASKRACKFGEHYGSQNEAEKKLIIDNIFSSSPQIVPSVNSKPWLGIEQGSPGSRSLEELRNTGLGFALYSGEKLYHGSPIEFKIGDIISSHPNVKNNGDMVAYASPDSYLAQIFSIDKQKQNKGWVYEVEPVNPLETIHSRMNYPDSRVHVETLTSSGYRIIGMKQL